MRKQQSFVFDQGLIILALVAIATIFEINRKSFSESLQPEDTALLFFSLYCRMASLASYLSEDEAKYQQNGDVHLA